MTATDVANTAESALVLARNPYLYRGYRYDVETGLYYLNSRYYDPETGRFINADGFVSTGQGILASNMFAYCGNDSVNRQDPNGEIFETIIGFFKTFLYETEQALASMAPAFAGAATAPLIDGPLPFGDIIGAAAGAALLSAAVIKGINQAIPRTIHSNPKSKTKEKERVLAEAPTKKYNYWQADLIRGTVVVSTPLSLSEACTRVSMGGSIMCRNEAAARTVVWINGYHNYVGPEIHGDCGFYHLIAKLTSTMQKKNQ